MAEILLDTLDRVATITLNRPDKLNAFAGDMREQLIAVLDDLSSDDEIRVVIITGAGRGFCAGGDVPNMVRLRGAGDLKAFEELLQAGARIVGAIREMDKPVLAAVNGVAAGAGCNLALACDYRLAATSARLGQTFSRIGLAPDWGGTWLLPRLVGAPRALELMVTGRMMSAEEAFHAGVVQRLEDDTSLMEATQALAREMASAPPLAVAAIKRLLRDSDAAQLSGQLKAEQSTQSELFLSLDAGEGLAAFVEKRKPSFEGR